MTTSEESNARIAQIEQLVRAGMIDAAEEACRQTVTVSPKEHRAWAWLAMLKIVRGQGSEAEVAIRQALAIVPGEAQYWNSLSLSLRLQYRFAEAESAARQALRLADTCDHWTGLGDCLFDQRQFAAAVQAYEQSLARNPQQAPVWTNLGAAEHSLGRLDRAEIAFQRSLALAPEDANALTRHALLQVQRGHIEQSIQTVHRILSKEPQLLTAWLLLGNAERMRDNWPEAEAAYRRAIEIAPRDRDARFNLALLLLQKSEYCEGERWVRQLVAENPNDAEALTILGAAHLSQAGADPALAAMWRSIELKPDAIAHGKYLGALHYAPSATPEQILAAHREWDAKYARDIRRSSRP